MAVRNRRSLSADHRRHDRLLIARHAAGDAHFGQDEEAVELIATCTECSTLADDIRHIARAVGSLPAVARPRDFRLTAEQADRLRGSRIERWLRALGSTGWSTVRPIAAVALSIGLVLTVVGVLPIGLPAAEAPVEMWAQQPERSQTTFGAQSDDFHDVAPAQGRTDLDSTAPVDSMSPELMVVQPSMAAGEAPFDRVYLRPSAAPEPGASDSVERLARPVEATPDLRTLLIYGGLSLAAVGFGMLVLTWLARSRFRDPLLR